MSEKENQDYLLIEAIEKYSQDYLNQTYLVDCLLKVSKKVLENEKAVREALDNLNSFIDSDAWINCAKEAITTFEPFCKPINKTKQGD